MALNLFSLLMVYRDGTFMDSSLCCIHIYNPSNGSRIYEQNMSVKELVYITTRGFGGQEHGAVSRLVNVPSNCDSDSYAKMWDK